MRLPSNGLRRATRPFRPSLLRLKGARKSVCLETYVYAVGNPGEAVRSALIRAAQRGVFVRVLIDGLGSSSLDAEFFDLLRAPGGEVRVFNPLTLRRLPVRSHRKLLVVDRTLAITGGFNVAPEYLGDGIHSGWRDIGIRLTGPVVETLDDSFEAMWERADQRPLRFPRLRRRNPVDSRSSATDGIRVLPSGPGRGRNAFLAEFLNCLEEARDVRIAVAYFLPGLALRAALRRVAARGGRVRILVPGNPMWPSRFGRGVFSMAGCCAPGWKSANTPPGSARQTLPSGRFGLCWFVQPRYPQPTH